MRTAIIIVWSVGLAGALVPTLVILGQASLVVRALLDIAKLAALTEQAASGIAKHVSVIPTLPDLAAAGGKLTATAQAGAGSLARTAAALIDLRGA